MMVIVSWVAVWSSCLISLCGCRLFRSGPNGTLYKRQCSDRFLRVADEEWHWQGMEDSVNALSAYTHKRWTGGSLWLHLVVIFYCLLLRSGAAASWFPNNSALRRLFACVSTRVSCTQVACEINFSTICSVLETDFWVSSDGVVYTLEIPFGLLFYIYIFSGQTTVWLQGMRGTLRGGRKAEWVFYQLRKLECFLAK